MTKYFQCDLSQGTTRTTAYIEERGAIVGKSVEIKEEGFDGRWLVEQVASQGIDGVALKDMQRMNRHFNQDI